MAFDGLKLIATPKPLANDPASKRRQRLIMQIDHQLYMAHPDNRARKSRGRWWSTDLAGNLSVAIKYGKVPLELAKGKHAIACDDLDAVVEALQQGRTIAMDGTFDSQLEAISAKVKARFKKE